MIKILFICHGNICRSIMAQWIMQKLVNEEGLADQFYIDSAATSREEIGNPIYPPAKRALKAHHVPIGEHAARQITKKDYALFDKIYYMDEINKRNLSRMLKNPDHKIHPLLPNESIADPWYTGEFETTYEQLERGCRQRLQEILYEG
jgi:protein-tyrosine phosphatase